MSDEKRRDSEARPSPITHHPSRLSIIVAMAKNRVIGANGAIPWQLPDELKLFKSLTLGHHIIMGRKTWESIGRLLPGRTTVIVSRNRALKVQGAIVKDTLEGAVEACGGDPEIFVVGGADLFRAALPLAGRLYLTTVEAEIAGDTYMPGYEPGEWREVSSQAHAADARHNHAYRHAVYERVRH
ncbi:MAG: dihydrofolate reductase [Betaproteobacteria bacterium]|nr:dihydrofolate reductase [Betaproteobacteria bacterium]